MAADGYLARYDAADPAAGIALLAGWLRTEWRELFAELREHRPVFHTPAFTLLTRHTDVTSALSRPGDCTVGLYTGPLEAALGGPIMLTRDGTPMNWREKGLMQVMLAPEDVPRVRELTGKLADQALDEAISGGRIEVVGDLFRRVPLEVCAEYFGFPGPDPETLSDWSRAVMTDVTANLPGDPGIRAAAVAAGTEMMDHLRMLVAERRAGPPGDDVLGRLVRTELPAELGFDDERLAINVAGLLLGFVENAAGSMTHLVRQLLDRPEALKAAADPERFEAYVWEALRFDPFLKVIARFSAREFRVPSGAVVPAGRLVLIAVASAMFDEDAVADPAEFVPGRPAHTLLHFGYGPHACVGVHPGAVVISETVRRLLLRPGVGPLPPPDDEVIRDRGIFPDRYTLAIDGGAS
jgi:cytochrome P450